jgi:hypothetical protein
MKKLTIVGALCVAVILPVHGAAASSAVEPTPPDPSIATYGNQTLDLTESWGTAKACLATATETRCFNSEREMDKYVATLGSSTSGAKGTASQSLGAVALAADCSSSVKLYSNTSYGGYLLQVFERLNVVDLAAYGFSNITSSYKIGACAAYFWDGVGGGAVYPGNTNAGIWSSTMVAGWDNRVSSLVLG